MRSMLGIHVMELSNPMMIVEFLRVVFVANIFYTLCIANIKLVVLAFYWRLFSIQSRTMIWVVAGMCLSWFVAIVGMPNHVSRLSANLSIAILRHFQLYTCTSSLGHHYH
jgi:hypothetical protein